MNIRRPGIWLLATLAMVSLTGRPFAAGTPAQSCQAAKNKEAGIYYSCRQKAEAGFATSGDNAKYAAALAKCVTKYQAKWSALEARAVALGSACPSVGDQAAIQGLIDQYTTNIATGIGGAMLQDCSPGGFLLKTGQTVCFGFNGGIVTCASSGQDGELQKGLTRAYADNGDGTITDTKTGLVWEKLSDDDSVHDQDTVYSWSDAFAKVAALNSMSFAGFNDWRLPNINELHSLLNYGGASPAIDAAFNTDCAPSCTVLTCSCTKATPSDAGLYWSSSTYQAQWANHWFAMFYDGQVDYGGGTNELHVRAVRGGS